MNYSKWDWHGGKGNEIFKREQEDFPIFDNAICALIDDLHERGLDKDTTVLVWGEFGRTPKISPQVGRDHWPQVAMALLAGGGMPMGQVIGATDRYRGGSGRTSGHLRRSIRHVVPQSRHRRGLDNRAGHVGASAVVGGGECQANRGTDVVSLVRLARPPRSEEPERKAEQRKAGAQGGCPPFRGAGRFRVVRSGGNADDFDGWGRVHGGPIGRHEKVDSRVLLFDFAGARAAKVGGEFLDVAGVDPGTDNGSRTRPRPNTANTMGWPAKPAKSSSTWVSMSMKAASSGSFRRRRSREN